MREVLEAAGHEVVGAGRDGFDGLNLYCEHRPELVLLDFTMPNRDGRDRARPVRARRSPYVRLPCSLVAERGGSDDSLAVIGPKPGRAKAVSDQSL
ncbi:MAG: response regulator [Gammaproteobacteria bacterium]|nr:response regulator [Gammaproteobacteria bacterium]